MTQAWIVPLAVAGFVLIVDLVTTYLRKRTRRVALPSQSQLTEERAEDPREEGVAIDQD